MLKYKQYRASSLASSLFNMTNANLPSSIMLTMIIGTHSNTSVAPIGPFVNYSIYVLESELVKRKTNCKIIA